MKILITGITGFVGGALANYFCNLGHQVTGLGRKQALPPHISDKCIYLQADISKPLAPFDADIVIHAAALASDTASFKEVYKVNVEGTQNVIKAAKKSGHFLYISSSSVYHFLTHSMRENEAGANYKKLSPYGQSKFLAEKSVINDQHIPKKTILRPRAIYGKYDQVLLPRLLKLVKGDKLFLPQNLSKAISLTHIDNLVQAVELCMARQAATVQILNVADKKPYDLYHILTTLLPLVTAQQLKIINIYKPLFILFVELNNILKLNKSFSRFAALSLTGTAILNIESITQTLEYHPVKNFNNSCAEIIDWIHKEEGWKFFSKKAYV